MRYLVKVKPSAEKAFLRLPTRDQDAISERLRRLEENPRPLGIVRLRGHDELRIRVGDFRVIYLIDDKNGLVDVLKIVRRNEKTYHGL